MVLAYGFFLIVPVLAIAFCVKALLTIARSAGRLKGEGSAFAGMILPTVHIAMYILILHRRAPAPDTQNGIKVV
ncbi:MAG: hypothetical protein QGD94_04900, partial [Planctomycetia bacterium]|nr:hypothetical protein [Planctomycetia bacterium]